MSVLIYWISRTINISTLKCELTGRRASCHAALYGFKPWASLWLCDTAESSWSGPICVPRAVRAPHSPSHLQVFIHCPLSLSLFLILYNCWECVVIRARKQSWLLILLITFRRNLYFENNINSIHSIYCSIALLLPLHYHFHPVVYSKWISWLLWEGGDMEDVTVAEARFLRLISA